MWSTKSAEEVLVLRDFLPVLLRVPSPESAVIDFLHLRVIRRVIQEGRGRRRCSEDDDVLEAGYAVAEQIRLEQITSSIQV